jgi:hypothetical protein
LGGFVEAPLGLKLLLLLLLRLCTDSTACVYYQRFVLATVIVFASSLVAVPIFRAEHHGDAIQLGSVNPTCNAV